MIFLIGMWVVMLIFSLLFGFVFLLVEWGQGIIMSLQGWLILEDIGVGGVCFVLIFLVMWNKGDDKVDFIFGFVCGFFFLFGGGVFVEMMFQIGQWILQVMQIGK